MARAESLSGFCYPGGGRMHNKNIGRSAVVFVVVQQCRRGQRASRHKKAIEKESGSEKRDKSEAFTATE